MSLPFVIPQNAQPPLDPRTGAFNRTWYLFFQAVFERIGGSFGTGNAVIDALISDLETQIATQPDAIAEVGSIRNGLTALQQAFAAYQVTQDARDDAQDARIADLEVLDVFT